MNQSGNMHNQWYRYANIGEPIFMGLASFSHWDGKHYIKVRLLTKSSQGCEWLTGGHKNAMR